MTTTTEPTTCTLVVPGATVVYDVRGAASDRASVVWRFTERPR